MVFNSTRETERLRFRDGEILPHEQQRGIREDPSDNGWVDWSRFVRLVIPPMKPLFCLLLCISLLRVGIVVMHSVYASINIPREIFVNAKSYYDAGYSVGL